MPSSAQLAESAGLPEAEPTSSYVLRHPPRRQNDQDDVWLTSLRVDPEDRFLFDHPLDHVPGELLVSGFLGVLRAVGAPFRPGCRIGLSVDFLLVCEIGGTTGLHARRGGGARGSAAESWTLDATQDDRTVCYAEAGFRTEVARAHGTASPSATGSRPPAGPVDAKLVHRVHPENVMVGVPAYDSDRIEVGVLTPPDGHLLARIGDGTHSVEGLIEAARQFITLLSHTELGHPLDIRLVWRRLTADLPCGLPDDTPLALRYGRTQSPGNRLDVCFDLVDTAAATTVGRLRWDVLAVSPAAYQRFRDRGRRA